MRFTILSFALRTLAFAPTKSDNQRQGGKGTSDATPDNATSSQPTVDTATEGDTSKPEASAADKLREAIEQQAIMLAVFLRAVPASRAGLMSFAWHERAADIVRAIKGIDIPRKAEGGRGLNAERRRLGDICRSLGGGYWSAEDDKDSTIVGKVAEDFGNKFHKEPVACLDLCRKIVLAVLEGRKLTNGASKALAVTSADVDAFKALVNAGK